MYQFHSYVNKFKIAGRIIDVEMTYSVQGDFEEIEGSFDFGDEEENKEYLQRFVDGELESVRITVTANALGLKGTSSLGACHIKTGSTDDMLTTVVENDMEHEARLDLENQLKAIAEATESTELDVEYLKHALSLINVGINNGAYDSIALPKLPTKTVDHIARMLEKIRGDK